MNNLFRTYLDSNQNKLQSDTSSSKPGKNYSSLKFDDPFYKPSFVRQTADPPLQNLRYQQEISKNTSQFNILSKSKLHQSLDFSQGALFNDYQSKKEQIKQIIEESKFQQQKISEMIQDDIHTQEINLSSRLAQRKRNVSVNRSLQTLPRENTSKSIDHSSSDSYEDKLSDDEIQTQLEQQKADQIYKIVQHYNKMINHYRENQDLENETKLIELEKEKWSVIAQVEQSFTLEKQ